MKHVYHNLVTGIFAIIAVLGLLTSGAYAQTAVIKIIISPEDITLAPMGNVQFQARVKEGNKIIQDAPLTWKAQGGTINSAGMYTAPAGAGQYKVTVTTTGAVSDTATVTVDPSIIPPYKLTSPNKGEIFKIGDTINITWESNLAKINDAGVSATVVGENNFVPIWPSSIIPEHDHWEHIKWVVPAKLNEVPLAGKQLVIQVSEYYGGEFDNSDMPVKIVANAGIKRRSLENLLGFPAPNRIMVNSSNPYRISIISLSGRAQYQYNSSRPYTLLLQKIGLAGGIYLIRLETGNKAITKTLPYLKAE
jgi:hypothetical protein